MSPGTITRSAVLVALSQANSCAARCSTSASSSTSKSSTLRQAPLVFACSFTMRAGAGRPGHATSAHAGSWWQLGEFEQRLITQEVHDETLAELAAEGLMLKRRDAAYGTGRRTAFSPSRTVSAVFSSSTPWRAQGSRLPVRGVGRPRSLCSSLKMLISEGGGGWFGQAGRVVVELGGVLRQVHAAQAPPKLQVAFGQLPFREVAKLFLEVEREERLPRLVEFAQRAGWGRVPSAM